LRCAPGAPWTERGEGRVDAGPPWIAFETHGPSLPVYHEPSARASNPFEIHLRDVAQLEADTCPA
jgi:hypothetical protein